jgi:hypothetical protein
MRGRTEQKKKHTEEEEGPTAVQAILRSATASSTAGPPLFLPFLPPPLFTLHVNSGE